MMMMMMMMMMIIIEDLLVPQGGPFTVVLVGWLNRLSVNQPRRYLPTLA
jgi:hypothetical protein